MFHGISHVDLQATKLNKLVSSGIRSLALKLNLKVMDLLKLTLVMLPFV